MLIPEFRRPPPPRAIQLLAVAPVSHLQVCGFGGAFSPALPRPVNGSPRSIPWLPVAPDGPTGHAYRWNRYIAAGRCPTPSCM
jgi:hypothetical protein